MKMFSTGLKTNLRTMSMIFILIVMWIFFRFQVGEFYFSGESVAKLSRDMVSWTILAAGVTLVLICGQIDLSIGSLLALVAASCALLMSPEYGPGLSANIAVPIAIIIGIACGALQGALVAYFKIPAFIVTLGGFFVFRGITLKVSEFDPRVPSGSWVVSMGFDYLPPSAGYLLVIGAIIVIALVLILNRRGRLKAGVPAMSVVSMIAGIVAVAAFLLGLVALINEYRGVPLQTLVMLLVLVVLHIVTRNTVFGRHLYAIGGNVEAARVAGVKVERNIVAVFALMGLLAGIAGVVWMAQNQGSTKNAGQFYELYAITGAVIGGTSLMGGRGTIFGTFLGGLVMATVVQGMDYTNLDNWLQLVARGGVLVIAVGVDVLVKTPPAWAQQLRRRFSRK
jgi:D-xylose transport system permease protein